MPLLESLRSRRLFCHALFYSILCFFLYLSPQTDPFIIFYTLGLQFKSFFRAIFSTFLKFSSFLKNFHLLYLYFRPQVDYIHPFLFYFHPITGSLHPHFRIIRPHYYYPIPLFFLSDLEFSRVFTISIYQLLY